MRQEIKELWDVIARAQRDIEKLALAMRESSETIREIQHEKYRPRTMLDALGE